MLHPVRTSVIYQHTNILVSFICIIVQIFWLVLSHFRPESTAICFLFCPMNEHSWYSMVLNFSLQLHWVTFCTKQQLSLFTVSGDIFIAKIFENKSPKPQQEATTLMIRWSIIPNKSHICHGTALPHLCAPVVLLRPSGLSCAHPWRGYCARGRHRRLHTWTTVAGAVMQNASPKLRQMSHAP